MKAKLKLFVVAAVMMFTATTTYGANESMMDLLKILRDKGTLTSSEYELLVNASKADKERVEIIKNETIGTVSKQLKKAKKAEGWATKVKVKGDIRLRYQYQDTDGGNARSRGRYRARIGIIGKPVDNFEAGVGIASGGTDPRSTNETFDDTFETKGAQMDYGYLQYKNGGLQAIGGKFKRKKYLYQSTDLMWDGDVNPEGFATKYTAKNAYGKAYAAAGILVLDEQGGSSDDPFMYYGQIGQKFKSGNIYGQIAGMYYALSDYNTGTSDNGGEHSAGTNTDDNFGGFVISSELGTKMGGAKVSVISDYINNLSTNTNEDSAYAVGFKWKYGKWKAKYIYADLEHNAVPDFLPDSDRFNGDTGIKGHEFAIGYKLNKRVSLGLDFYATEDDVTNVNQEILQLDLKMKF
ncbi:MAG: hypothetical protein CBC29_00645 [Methylococcaceae bacterium TMED69]|nr:MAG: hypothetical protein CBC29_00645 [Methylococcaceae bacterium TMED69]